MGKKGKRGIISGYVAFYKDRPRLCQPDVLKCMQFVLDAEARGTNQRYHGKREPAPPGHIQIWREMASKGNKLINKWRDPQDNSVIAYGTAQAFANPGEKHFEVRKKFAEAHGFYKRFLSVFAQHRPDCGRKCTEVHQPSQQGMMLVPNGSPGVAAGAPPRDEHFSGDALDSAPSPSNSIIVGCCDKNNGSPSSAANQENIMHTIPSPSRNDDDDDYSSIYRQPDADYLLLRQNIGELTNSLHDLSVNDITDDAGIRKASLVERGRWLVNGENKVLKKSMTFEQILAHWVVNENIQISATTRLLKLLDTFEPKQINYDALPLTGRSLLTKVNRPRIYTAKVDESESMEIKEIRSEPDPDIYPIAQPRAEWKFEEKPLGRYIHFGLEKAILGTSIGLMYYSNYVSLLRRIHTSLPFFLPDMFLDLTKPHGDEPYNEKTWISWATRPETANHQSPVAPEPIVFEVKLNVDGVQFFEASPVKGIPILGKLTAIRSLSGKRRIKIPYDTTKVFIVGVYLQTHNKPGMYRLMEDTIQELKKFSPDTLKAGGSREGEWFAIELSHFYCDAPMRADLKGTKASTGFYSCERCFIRGFTIQKGADALEYKSNYNYQDEREGDEDVEGDEEGNLEVEREEVQDQNADEEQSNNVGASAAAEIGGEQDSERVRLGGQKRPSSPTNQHQSAADKRRRTVTTQQGNDNAADDKPAGKRKVERGGSVYFPGTGSPHLRKDEEFYTLYHLQSEPGGKVSTHHTFSIFLSFFNCLSYIIAVGSIK